MPDEQTKKELESLWSLLDQLRKEEGSARDARVAIELAISRLIDCPEVGSKTVTLESGRKVTVKRGVTYKADIQNIAMAVDKLNAVRATKPIFNKAYLPVKTKTVSDLDEKGYEWYRKHDKEAFDAMAEHVEVRPRKTGVTITEAKTKP